MYMYMHITCGHSLSWISSTSLSLILWQSSPLEHKSPVESSPVSHVSIARRVLERVIVDIVNDRTHYGGPI